MGDVLQFPAKREDQGWVCGCGGFNWVLYANGDCLCLGCNYISTVIKVIKQETDMAQDDLPDASSEPRDYLHETLRYPCGCEASGPYPLPTYCSEHGSEHRGEIA